jgi:hypothetical protein
MATIKAYTDLAQSRKLAEILPLESADMIYTITNYYHTPFIRIEEINEMDESDILCWSLAALLGVLNCPELTQTSDGGWFIRTWYINHPYNISGVNAIDVCYKMILKLHELKML